MTHAFSSERKLAPAGLELHLLSAVWPRMERDKKAEFLDDITKNGVREDIVLYEGKVLDGGHRYSASLKAEVECYFVEYVGDDPVAYVISKNAMRRQAAPIDIATAVLKCYEWRPTGRPPTPAPAPEPAPAAPVQAVPSIGAPHRCRGASQA